MEDPKLSKLEFEIMETLWSRGESSIREIQDAFPAKRKPAYTTVQTTVYRLERKGAVRCVKRISNANMFGAVMSRDDAQGRLIDDILHMFGGKAKPVMARLIESGQLTLDDVKEAEDALRKLSRRKRDK